MDHCVVVEVLKAKCNVKGLESYMKASGLSETMKRTKLRLVCGLSGLGFLMYVSNEPSGTQGETRERGMTSLCSSSV
jgi:hypothetical protein